MNRKTGMARRIVRVSLSSTLVFLLLIFIVLAIFYYDETHPYHDLGQGCSYAAWFEIHSLEKKEISFKEFSVDQNPPSGQKCNIVCRGKSINGLFVETPDDTAILKVRYNDEYIVAKGTYLTTEEILYWIIIKASGTVYGPFSYEEVNQFHLDGHKQLSYIIKGF